MLKKTAILFISFVIFFSLSCSSGCKKTAKLVISQNISDVSNIASSSSEPQSQILSSETVSNISQETQSKISEIQSNNTSETLSKITSETESFVTSEESIPDEFRDMKDITPDSLKGKGFRILKNCESCLSIILIDGESYTLGASFGGFGVVDIKYYEKLNYLLYTYSSGSGIHRSNIGVFDLNKKKTIFNSVNFFDIDVMLSTTDKDGIYDVYEADVNLKGGFCDIILTKAEKLGTLSVADKGIVYN